MTKPMSPSVMSRNGNASNRTIGPISPLTTPKTIDRTIRPIASPFVRDQIERRVRRQHHGQDPEGDGRYHCPDDESPHQRTSGSMGHLSGDHGQRDARADDRRRASGEDIAVEHDDVRIAPTLSVPRRLSAKAAHAEPWPYAESASGSDSFSEGSQPPGGWPSTVCRFTAALRARNGSNGRAGQSDPSAMTPPAWRIDAHDQAWPARSGPMAGAQTSIWLRARIGVVGLHRGDDAQVREPRDVGPCDRLDVLDPVTAVAGAIGGRGTFVRIERHPDRGIACGMRLDLPATSVGLGDVGIEVPGVPEREAGLVIVDVGVEQRGGPGLDAAVGVCLQDPGVQPGVVAKIADELRILLERVAATPEMCRRPSAGERVGLAGRASRRREASATAAARRARPRRPGSR